MAALTLNDAQQDAVTTSDNILCCACPGSGKTRVLIAKVKHVLKTHPDPRIVMTTFSRDAAEEMLERIKKEKSIGPDDLARLTIGTFHSLALRQLKEIGKVGKILSEIEVRHLINRALHDTGTELSVEDADGLIARCKADSAFAQANPELAKLTACYQKHQTAIGGQDFTDLLIRANELMAAGKLKPIQATHIMGDEFQDIDQMQFDWLMHHMAQEPVACAVGDDDQSIYAFRHSLGYRGMMEFVAATGARIITLDTNYRSTSGIVNSASRLIGYNVDRVPKKITAARGHGPEPRVIALAKEESQAMRIVHALDVICADNKVPPPAPNREPYRFGVKMGQAAVLARTNAHLHIIENTFRNANVPYLRVGRSFWDTPLLQVYLSILQSLDRRDGMGLEIALRWAQMSDSFVRELIANAGGSLWNYIRPDGPQACNAGGSAEVASLINHGRGWTEKLGKKGGTSGVIMGVAAWMLGVMTKTTAMDDDGHPIRAKGRRELRDITLLEAARDSLDQARGSLRTRIMAMTQGDNQSFPRVILSTFHASKGLEWDHVFLVDVYAGTVPKVSDIPCDEEISEERRVFYVAMTRARDSLTIYSRSDLPVSEFIVDAELCSAISTNPQEQATLVS